MSIKKSFAAIGLGLALVGTAWWLFPRPRPAILLITIDTLRPDRLGAYGSHSVETPNLDRIARDGITFTHALANVPLTLPSHASILTGTYPLTHTIRDNGDFLLPAGVPTLAERLKARGYNTAAFVGSYVLASRFGLNRGFDVYDDAFGASQGPIIQPEAPERRADEVVAAAIRWLEQRKAPFFCWIHLNDPHTPYDPPEPYRSRYHGHLYDGEVAFTDAALRPLFELLIRKNLYDRMVVVAAGDHGESLGEHGESTHGYFIYQSTMHVPLLLKMPGARIAGKRIAESVSLIDLTPTLLAFSGVMTSQLRGLHGADLMRLRESTEEPRPVYGESYYSRLNFGWNELRSLSIGNWKYIEAPVPELYRLDQDPSETRNIAQQRQDLIAEMHARLLALESKATSLAPGEAKSRLDPSALAKLRSLGYVAGFPEKASQAAARLPDPKEKLKVYQEMVGAQELIAGGQHMAALKQFESALRSDPNMALAHHQLGGCYLVLGRPADATREFERALALNPQFVAARFNLGVAWIQEGRFQEAARDFEQILRENPNDYESLNYLGMALSGAGNDLQAMQALRRATAAQPSFGEAHFNLGRLQIRAQDYSGALESFTKAEWSGFSSARLHADFGWLRMQRNEVDAAIEEYTMALKINPDDPIVHNNLGFALAAKGDLDAAVHHYRRALELQPSYDRARANLVAALAKASAARFQTRQ
jgi:arylsulfatase A-like enzyme/tetratricopeptide (TPR) repeat protein